MAGAFSDNIDTKTPGPSGPGFVMSRPAYSSEECQLVHQSLIARIEILERRTMDHEQRFDTLQTPFWKRIWFWIDGWPWHDLNGSRKRRPWHGNG